jgi:hypothetical protein
MELMNAHKVFMPFSTFSDASLGLSSGIKGF